MDNYSKLVERISRSSGVDKEEINRKIEAKQAKLSGLISKEGAAQIIAAELGINFDSENLKINELVPGMRKVNTIGKIINLYPVRSFKTKKGEDAKVANLILADDTSNIKVVFWDTNHIELIENGKIQEGSIIELANGTMRENEIHLGSFSEVKLTNIPMENIVTDRVLKEKYIKDFVLSDNIKSRAFIVQGFDPRIFFVCNECKKKVDNTEGIFKCAEHGRVEGEKRALVNLVIDDGTGTIRAVVFHDNLKKLNISDLDNTNMLVQQRENLLGKELVFSGNVRKNSYFNSPEFIINSIEEVNLDNLINGFEKGV